MINACGGGHCDAQSRLLGQGSTLSAVSTQAVPSFAPLLAGAACQDKPDEAQPHPNNGHFNRAR
ncbi:MAG: hypothetical protein LBD59_03230 [Prevotellaceae bacterium]|nr:hypothetical protein [Prevotellaceae bacterium]